MGTPKNIVIGMNHSSTVKIGDYNSQESAATDLGYIKGGVIIEHNETSYDIKVDQVLGIIDKVTTDESLKIKVSLAEASLSNIAMAFGYSAASSAKTFSFGHKGNTPIKTLFVNVLGTGVDARRYTFWKCRPTGKTVQTYKCDGETLVEIEFDVLSDTSKAITQRFGKIDDGTSL